MDEELTNTILLSPISSKVSVKRKAGYPNTERTACFLALKPEAGMKVI